MIRLTEDEYQRGLRLMQESVSLAVVHRTIAKERGDAHVEQYYSDWLEKVKDIVAAYEAAEQVEE